MNWVGVIDALAQSGDLRIKHTAGAVSVRVVKGKTVLASALEGDVRAGLLACERALSLPGEEPAPVSEVEGAEGQ